ncbi:MAG: response regulator transcription factor [Candidatus Aureabacteria bacterium]|nr:response regulator transcription factor [Candidatus Auribacterota bacterium]
MDRKKKILIVEDNEKDLQIVVEHLSDENYEIITERNGEDALDYMEMEKPDLIILDLILPEIDGFQICQKVNKARSNWNPKVIIITALTPVLDKFKSDWLEKTQANALLTKPVSKEELLSRIKSLLD